MPDKRVHRGPHPEDAAAFAPAHWPALRRAVGEFSWLLTRGYAEKSAIKLVGDRYSLTQRQRTAVWRCACADDALAGREERELAPENVAGLPVLLDGYNILTTVEAALAGGVIIEGRDRCLRDLASMHGTFRKVHETAPAIALIGGVLQSLAVKSCVWYLDRPVSNSGRLRKNILELAAANQWPWTVELSDNPDALLAAADEVIVTADSVILDRCARWLNLARLTVQTQVPAAWLIRLVPEEPSTPAGRA